MKNIEETLIDGTGVTTDQTSQAIDLKQMAGYAIQSVWTGTLAGNLIVQKSVDGTTWFTEDTQALGGAPGVDLFEKVDAMYRFVRMFADISGGAGDLETKLIAKG